MAEENQVMKEPQQVTKEPQRGTTKDPKKVEVGKRLAAINHKKREEAQNGGMNQYYGIGFSCTFGAGAVIAVGVIGGLDYYIYQTKKAPQPPGRASPAEKSRMFQCHIILLSPNNHSLCKAGSLWDLSLISLIWIKSLLYYKNEQEEYSK